MDTELMLFWIDRILVPYLQEKKPQTKVVLIMDNYPVHTCEETIGKLEGIGVTPHIVPGGCTSYCQPLGVGVNKPFKDRVKGRWMDWVMNGDITQPIIKNPD